MPRGPEGGDFTDTGSSDAACRRDGRDSAFRRFRLFWLLLLCCCAAGIGGPAAAAWAGHHGSLVGEVLNADGDREGSVRVLLLGLDGVAEQVTDLQGRFRFARLAPGTYSLEIRRDDELIASYEPVAVRMGRPTTLRVQVRAEPEATLVVTSEPPATAIEPASEPRVDAGEIGLLAADRDPFRAVQSAGVQTVRSHTLAPEEETGVTDETWTYDGVRMSSAPDASLPGGVRVQVLSSADAARGSADSVIDIVTPKRSAERRGDLRLDYSDRSWQRDTAPAGTAQPEHVTGIAGAGLEAGLELVADRLWSWGSWQAQEVSRRAVGGPRVPAQESVSESRHLALKLNAQPWRALSAELGYHDTDRSQDGEGAAPDRSLEATRLELAPSRWTSLSLGLVAGSKFSFAAQAAQARDAASLVPTAASGGIVLDSSGVWRGGFAELHHRENRDQFTVTGEAHHDLDWIRHRVRFGYENRDTTSFDSERWGANNLQLLAGENFGSPFDLVRVRRSGTSVVSRKIQGAWVQDSLTFGRLTLDAGLRLDHQSGRARNGEAQAHPLLPDLLPALTYDGSGSRVRWHDLSPRLGLAWALGRDRDTILRVSRATFASTLHDDLIQQVSPVAGGELLLALDGSDGKAHPEWHPDPSFEEGPDLTERLLKNRLVQAEGLDVSNPSGQANAFGPGFSAERVDELNVSLEHHVARATELALTWSERLTTGILERRLLVRDAFGDIRPAQRFDYRLDHVESGLLPDGSPYAVPVYGLVDGVAYTGGSQLSNGDRTLKRKQLTASFYRRMSGGLQARGHVTWTDWQWNLGWKFRSFDDPTDETTGVDSAGIHRLDEAGSTSPGTGGASDAGRWSFDVSALYQIGRGRSWGFDVGASLHGREGYQLDYALEVAEGDRLRQVQVAADHLRVDDLVTVDLRLQKEVRLGLFGDSDAVLALDVFNLLNSGAVLERELSLRTLTTGEPRRTLSPRVFQIGLRLALP
ncbi:MAG: TonB-dependent receptor [Thermoanaerobaculia bacterium]|nr:TonB-dependent receptor [Thermoanaerobaculia bacterium]